jgi:hypothetical protein
MRASSVQKVGLYVVLVVNESRLSENLVGLLESSQKMLRTHVLEYTSFDNCSLEPRRKMKQPIVMLRGLKNARQL